MLTKALWLAERTIAPRKKRWWNKLKPISCSSQIGSSGNFVVSILGTPSTLDESLWAAWSVKRFLGSHTRVRLYFDKWKSVPETFAKIASSLLGPVEILPTCSLISSFLDRKLDPVTRNFCSEHPLAVKLLVALCESEDDDVLYMDNDVLFLNEPKGVPFAKTNCSSGENRPLYIQEECGGCWDPQVLNFLESNRLPIKSKLNGGLHWIPKQSLDCDFAIHIIKNFWVPGQPPNWFSEQTINSALFARAGAKALCKERFVVSNTRQFYFEDDIDYNLVTARHYTGPVRHVMYLKAYAHLIRSSND